MLVAGGVAAFIAENQGPLSADKLYAGSLGAALFLLAGSLLEAHFARRFGPRARVDLWRATTAAAALLAVATWFQVAPLFDRPTYLAGVSSRWERLEPEHFIVPLGAALAALLLRRRSVPSALPLRAIASALAALVVLVGAEVRLRRGAPPWSLLDRLPVVMRLPEVDRSRGTSVTLHQGDDLWVRRFWSAQYPAYCDLSAARTEGGLVASVAPERMVPVGCGPLTLRALTATNEYAVLRPPEAYRNVFVLDEATLARVPLGRATLGDYAAELAPPRGWVRASWGLLALAVMALGSRREARRWREGRARWRAATLGADRSLRFDDGGVATLSYGAVQTPGPVVVLAAAALGEAGPFRAGAGALEVSADDVRAGTPANVLAELDATRDAAWARLTATAWLAMAPIAPFIARGVWGP